MFYCYGVFCNRAGELARSGGTQLPFTYWKESQYFYVESLLSTSINVVPFPQSHMWTSNTTWHLIVRDSFNNNVSLASNRWFIILYLQQSVNSCYQPESVSFFMPHNICHAIVLPICLCPGNYNHESDQQVLKQAEASHWINLNEVTHMIIPSLIEKEGVLASNHTLRRGFFSAKTR
jgi:hypothetical protein